MSINNSHKLIDGIHGDKEKTVKTFHMRNDTLIVLQNGHVNLICYFAIQFSLIDDPFMIGRKFHKIWG
ncbi:4598_t:CDS:2, partial [Entrophospora sp. SA101]